MIDAKTLFKKDVLDKGDTKTNMYELCERNDKKGKNSCTLLAFVSGRLEPCSVYSWSELGGA